MFKHNPVD